MSPFLASYQGSDSKDAPPDSCPMMLAVSVMSVTDAFEFYSDWWIVLDNITTVDIIGALATSKLQCTSTQHSDYIMSVH